MNPSDEKLRATVHDALTRASVDSRNLAIEAAASHLTVKGSVPSEDQQEQLGSVLRRCVPKGSLDCTDSAHESRHKLDRS